MFKEELIIIRHGRSRHNTRDTEGLDESLTEFGYRQAKNVGDFFREEMNIHGFGLYTSPFLRCLQTMQGIASAINTELETVRPYVMEDLREYLNHSGKSASVVNRRLDFPSFGWDEFPKGGRIYDEEFNEVFLHRMHNAYDKLWTHSLVVTHGLPAMVLLNIAINPSLSHVPVWDHSLDNCSISIIRRGRLIWHGRNLYHEMDFDPKFYRRDWDGVTKPESSK